MGRDVILTAFKKNIYTVFLVLLYEYRWIVLPDWKCFHLGSFQKFVPFHYE